MSLTLNGKLDRLVQPGIFIGFNVYNSLAVLNML